MSYLTFFATYDHLVLLMALIGSLWCIGAGLHGVAWLIHGGWRKFL